MHTVDYSDVLILTSLATLKGELMSFLCFAHCLHLSSLDNLLLILSSHCWEVARLHNRRQRSATPHRWEWATFNIFQHGDSAAVESIPSHLSVRLFAESNAIFVVNEPQLHEVEVLSWCGSREACCRGDRAMRRRSNDVGESVTARCAAEAALSYDDGRTMTDDQWSDNVHRGRHYSPFRCCLSLRREWITNKRCIRDDFAPPPTTTTYLNASASASFHYCFVWWKMATKSAC